MADKATSTANIATLITDELDGQNTAQDVRDALGVALDNTETVGTALGQRITSEAGRASQAETALGDRIDGVATIAGNKITSQQAGTQFDLGLDVALADGGKIRNVFDGLTAADIAYGDGTVESTLNAEPTLHDDAVSTETYTAGLALKQNVADVRSDGAVRALAEAQITTEIQAGGKIADLLANDPAIVANTAKIGTTATERSRIAQIPTLASSVSNNNAKPTTTQVDAQADARIVEQIKAGGTIDEAIKALDIPTGGVARWNATTTYNTDDVVFTDTGIYRAITDNVVSAVFEPAVGSAWEAGWVLLASVGGGMEGALVLEDFAPDTTERLCGVSGAETDPIGGHHATLTLECDGETPTEGTASLGGVIRFTANSAWNGKFVIVDAGDGFNGVNGTATQISGGDTGEQEWRFDGLEWDFANISPRAMRLDSDFNSGSVFTPAITNLTYTFDGELTRGDPAGQAVAPVEAIIGEQLVFDLFETVVGSTAEVRPGTTYTGNRGYQNDNGDDVPQTPPATATFTIPTSGATVSDGINALADGDLIRLTGMFNPNQTYVNGSQTATRLVVMQGSKMIKTIDNLAPNGETVILDGVKKGTALTVTMTFTYNGITATMQPYVGGMDVSFTGRMYHDLDRFVATRVAEAVDPIKGAVGELGAGLAGVRDTGTTNTEGIKALKKTVVGLGAKHTDALDVFGAATVSDVETRTLTETTTAYTKTRHDNPTQFNEGLVNLTSGDLTIGDVVLASVKNGGLFFNLHDGGSPASSTVVPRYIGRSNGESNPVELHLDSDVTATLTNNLPPAGSPVRIFVEADVNGIDEDDTQLDLVATVGQTVTHEVLHLGAVITLTATWQANGLLLQTVKSGTQNQAVDGGRLLVNPVWQETVTTDKVDPSDTLTRVADHHGNAALYIHSVGDVYHIDYSGGSFETNTAHTGSTAITTALPWVITVDSNFPANMHDLQAQADANNEYLGLWSYVTSAGQVVTVPAGLAYTQPDGTVVSAGGGGATPTISAFYVNANATVAYLQPTLTNIVMATPSLNQGGDMDNAGVYTAPETGIYWMAFTLAMAASGNTNYEIRGGLSIDGAPPTEQQDSGFYRSNGSRDFEVAWSGAVALTKGQTVRLQGVALNSPEIIATETYFSGYLIGKTG